MPRLHGLQGLGNAWLKRLDGGNTSSETHVPAQTKLCRDGRLPGTGTVGGAWGMRSGCLMGPRFPSEAMKNFWKRSVQPHHMLSASQLLALATLVHFAMFKELEHLGAQGAR